MAQNNYCPLLRIPSDIGVRISGTSVIFPTLPVTNTACTNPTTSNNNERTTHMRGLKNPSRLPHKYHRGGGRLTQLNTTMNHHDVDLFEDLMAVLRENHLMDISRSFAVKFAISTCLRTLRHAQAEGSYSILAKQVMEMMKKPEVAR